jgi:hypothetical protein
MALLIKFAMNKGLSRNGLVPAFTLIAAHHSKENWKIVIGGGCPLLVYSHIMVTPVMTQTSKHSDSVRITDETCYYSLDFRLVLRITLIMV